jgi:hypothetical protein
MSGGLWLQYVLIALAVAASAAYVVRHQWPDRVRRLRIACALPLMREGRRAGLQRLGRWIAPRERLSAGACGTGCNGCGPS